MSSEPVKFPSPISLRAGFTMIELMVVVAIIVMASGVMGPTIMDFMKNRELEGIRGQFGKIFNKARLDAVIFRQDMSVVFFREGPRVYDELSKRFTDKAIWSSKGDALGSSPPEIWYGLGFAGGISSYDEDKAALVAKSRKERGSIPRSIPSFADWAADPRSLYRSQATGSGRSSRGSSGDAPELRYRTNDLYKMTFNRSGTMVFSAGCSDVPTSIFNNDGASGRPKTADVVILQYDSQMACFIDVRPTGQMRSKVRPLGVIPIEAGDVSPITGGEKRTVSSRRTSGKKSRK